MPCPEPPNNRTVDKSRDFQSLNGLSPVKPLERYKSQDQRSPILSAPTIPGFSLEERDFVAGVARVAFDQGELMGVNAVSISNGDTGMSGEPVIGFVIQQFANGTLIDSDGNRVRANYRAATRWGGFRDLRENSAASE